MTHTLETATIAFYDSHRCAWRSRTHAHDWLRSFERHAWPTLGSKPCSAVTAADILTLIKALNGSPVLADRLRARLALVLAWAAVVEGRPPAEWLRHLPLVLPRPPRHRHFRAMGWSEIPRFVARLDDRPADLALKWLILTVARRGEVLQCDRRQVSSWERIWYLPATATKANEARRIPLHPAATPWLCMDRMFPIGGCAMLRRLRALDPYATLHGFRSAFVGFAQECAEAAPEVIAACLGHTAGSSTWRSYARGDLLGRRVPLMEAWGDFVLGQETAR